MSPNGLTCADAAARLVANGPNRLPSPPSPHVWRKLAGQFSHFFAAMLWLAGLLAGFLLVPPVARLLGQAVPPIAGLTVAALAAPLVLLFDAVHKRVRANRRTSGGLALTRSTSMSPPSVPLGR